MTDRKTITHEMVARAMAALELENLPNISCVTIDAETVRIEYVGIIHGTREDYFYITGNRGDYARVAEETANMRGSGEISN